MDKSNGSIFGKVLGLLLFAFAAVAAAPASAQIAPNGRWEFAVTSGDTQYELDLTGQTTFSTYLSLTGTTLSGDSQQTTNTTAAEIFCCNDSIGGTFRKHDGTTTAVVEFAIPANSATGQVGFNYTFTGTYNANPSNSGGPTITGTYTTNASSAYSNGSGTFVATWFPDFPATPLKYMGGLTGSRCWFGPERYPDGAYTGHQPHNAQRHRHRERPRPDYQWSRVLCWHVDDSIDQQSNPERRWRCSKWRGCPVCFRRRPQPLRTRLRRHAVVVEWIFRKTERKLGGSR